MTGLEIVFKDFYNFVTSNFLPTLERVKTFFQNLTFDKIAKAIKENLIERFESAIEVLGFLGDAVKKFFKGDFSGALDSAKEAGKEFGDVVTGVDNSIQKAGDAITGTVGALNAYAKSVAKAAKETTKLNNQALISEAINKGLLEQYDRQAEKLRQIRDDESATIEDRIAANNELADVLNEQEKVMLRNAEIAIRSAQNNLAINDTVENQVALIEARNEKLAILAAIEGKRSEQLVNTNSLLRERNDLEKEDNEKIEARQKEIDSFKENQDKLTQIKKDAEQERTDNTIASETELREKQKQEQEKAAQDEITRKNIVEDTKVEIAYKTAGTIATLADESSTLGKVTAAAAATINTYQGITAELATKTATPFEFGLKIANIAATTAIGFKAVKDILSTNPSNASAAPTSGGRGTSAPNFNLVAGTGSNQIAQGIASEPQPLKAFVVSSEVTTAQSLDKNIIDNAGF